MGPSCSADEAAPAALCSRWKAIKAIPTTCATMTAEYISDSNVSSYARGYEKMEGGLPLSESFARSRRTRARRDLARFVDAGTTEVAVLITSLRFACAA